MAVRWTAELAEKVDRVLTAHPVSSGRCGSCAAQVREIALEVDKTAQCLSVRPAGRERFVVPKKSLGSVRWYYHFTADVTEHCVDVLTSVSGTMREQYLETHWKYADALIMKVEEPDG